MEFNIVFLVLTQEERKLLDKLKNKIGLKDDKKVLIHCLRRVAKISTIDPLLISELAPISEDVVYKSKQAPQVVPKLEPEPARQAPPEIEPEPAPDVYPELEPEPSSQVPPEIEPEPAPQIILDIEPEPESQSPQIADQIATVIVDNFKNFRINTDAFNFKVVEMKKRDVR